MKRIKYTKEMLEELVKKSFSVSQILKQLELLPGGGTHWFISKKIKSYGIDTSHFKGYGINEGRVSTKKKSWNEMLIKKQHGENRTGAQTLRRSLIESGREYKCEDCGLKDTWNNKPICVQVDHIDGDGLNNTPINLKFLCPNCHSQTSTFGVKNHTYIKDITKTCQSCGNTFESEFRWRKYCSKTCANQRKNKSYKTKIVWPSKEELKRMLSESNYLQLGIKLGVSDNAIRKHLK